LFLPILFLLIILVVELMIIHEFKRYFILQNLEEHFAFDYETSMHFEAMFKIFLF